MAGLVLALFRDLQAYAEKQAAACFALVLLQTRVYLMLNKKRERERWMERQRC